MTLSLPLRISLISLVFAGVVATVLTGLGGVFLYHQQMENAANRAYFAAEELAGRAQRLLSLEMRVDDFLNFDQQCAAVIQNDGLLSEAALADGGGRLRYRSAPGLSESPLPAILPAAAGSASPSASRRPNGNRVVLPVLQRDRSTVAAYAVVAIDEAAVLRSTLQVVAWLALSALALFAVAVVLQQYIFWRTIGRPLGTLVNTADAIQPDHLSLFPGMPAHLNEADDIGRLYGAFSRLMHRLLEARRQLVAHNEALEATVQERTAQLTAANSELALDIRRREQLEHELLRLANTDGLTGLANRAFVIGYLAKRIDHAKRHCTALGLMLFDLDGFKFINDTYGHAAGDEALKVMAQRLRDTCRESDLVARLGGDEFLLVFEQLDSEAGVAHLARRVIGLFHEPFDWQGRPLKLGVSIGAALLGPHGNDINTLMAQADFAMYAVKQQGGGYRLAGADADLDSDARVGAGALDRAESAPADEAGAQDHLRSAGACPPVPVSAETALALTQLATAPRAGRTLGEATAR